MSYKIGLVTYLICRAFNLVIISSSTCCLVGLVKAIWVCASFDSNLVIISCSTCCLVGPVKATWVCASFDSNLVIISCHVFICISLKLTLSSGQKPVYTVKILISEQIAFVAVLYLGQVSCILQVNQ